MGRVAARVAGLKDPEYTGKNRCLPCTFVNSLIAVFAGVVVSLAAAFGGIGEFAVPLGIATLVVAAGAIYFKGYLVPGTPTLTKRYFPEWALAAFGKDQHAPGASGAGEATDDKRFDVERVLLQTGALTERDDGEDLRLTDEFRGALLEQFEVVRDEDVSRERLFDVLDAEPGDVRFEEYGEAFRAFHDDQWIGTWESREAFLADVAAAEVLGDRMDGWESTHVRLRGKLLEGLRLFLTTCPGCGGELSFGVDTVESCCSTQEVAAVTCDDCGARLFESNPVD